LTLRPSGVGALLTGSLHVAVLGVLLTYEPARSALLAATPIMVDLLSPLRPEPPKPQPRVEPPRPKPVVKRVQPPPEPTPVLSAPAEAPAPIVMAPPPVLPTPPEPVAAAPEPAPVTAPIFNAHYLDNPEPPYPALSRRSGEQGRVILRVRVSPRGAAEEVEVRTSSGFPRLDQSARETVLRWKFVPAKRGAEAVPAWVLVPISFRLES
jgi:periplasmic protein TonB